MHLLTDSRAVGPVEINAFQLVSDVVLQRSLREGFGLTVTEALWKGRPVIARPMGGILIQIEHARSGFLVPSAEECAELMVSIIENRRLAHRIGIAVRRPVRQGFLMPRLLRDELRLYLQVSGTERAQAVARRRA